MPVTIVEQVDSREISGGSITMKYKISGTSTESAALAALGAGTAVTYAGLVRETNPTLDPIWVDEGANDGQWHATLRYTPPCGKADTPPEIGSVRIRGTTKGGSMHIERAVDTVAAYGESKNGTAATVDDYGDMIGLTSDGVEGVDIGTGAFDFTVTKVFDGSALPNLATLYTLSAPWHTNTAAFTVTDTVTGLTITLAAGECVFKGADFGEARADGGVEFSMDFSASPNATGLKVGTVTGIAKKGWEYLWARYKLDVVGALGETAPKPHAAYVVQTYPAGNFSGLGL